MSQIENNAAASDQPTPDAPPSRRIAASRANGALSTGPTTPVGQAALAASPRNFRHGMLAQTVVLASESRARFEALVDELWAEFRPITKAERTLVETMASARWRQMRAVCFQKNDLDLEIARQQSASPTPHTPPVAATLAFRVLSDKSNSLSNAMRHEVAFERQFNRALRQLTALLQAPGRDGIEPTTTATDPISTWDDASQTFDNDLRVCKKVILQFTPSPISEHHSAQRTGPRPVREGLCQDRRGKASARQMRRWNTDETAIANYGFSQKDGRQKSDFAIYT